jgi:hypothetical protein
MPTFGGYYYHFAESEPRRWEQCLARVKADMLTQGWVKHAGKFMEVQHRRARSLFYKEKK